jgi:hypothetical protein
MGSVFAWRIALIVGLALCLALPTAMARAQSDMRSSTADARNSLGPITFDIPAQPLFDALETYAAIAGQEVIFDGALATDRRSTAVVGRYSSEDALRLLLKGTGLLPRYMRANAFVLVVAPPVAQRRLPVNEASPALVKQYYGRLQSGIKAALCGSDGAQPGDYRVAVSFWIDPTGVVSRVVLFGSTGERERDATIKRMLQGLTIGAPPSGFAQPVTVIVEPWSPGMTLDCQVSRAQTQELRAAAP